MRNEDTRKEEGLYERSYRRGQKLEYIVRR